MATQTTAGSAHIVLPLAQLRPYDPQAGYNARALARLARLRLPVSPTVVVRHNAWQTYLQAHSALAAWQSFSSNPSQDTAAPLRDLLAQQPLPARLLGVLHDALATHIEPVALSALPLNQQAGRYTVHQAFGGIDDAFAPQHLYRSQLGVGATALDAAIRSVWAAAFSVAAVEAYRRNGHPTALSLLVQAIPPLDCAGLLLNESLYDPVALEVRAVWGLAEQQHRERPDRWLLARVGGRVLSHEPGERRNAYWPTAAGLVLRQLEPWAPAPLSSQQLDILRLLGLRIAHILGGPLNFEWAADGTRFWIMQTRPFMAGAGS